jgi:hypothetical protein
LVLQVNGLVEVPDERHIRIHIYTYI